jgi:hypothetical protein
MRVGREMSESYPTSQPQASKPVVFILFHFVVHSKFAEDTRLIGLFSSRKKVEEAIALLSGKPGFSDQLGIYEACETSGFEFGEVEIDKVGWQDGFVSV